MLHTDRIRLQHSTEFVDNDPSSALDLPRLNMVVESGNKADTCLLIVL